MALRIVDCQATQKSITVFFSEAVQPPAVANFAVYDPTVNPAALPPTGIAILPGNGVKLSLAAGSVNVGDHILVSVTGITLPAGSQEPPPGPLAIGAVVQSELTIANCLATPGLVVVYFSEPLDMPVGPNNPNNPSNYAVSIDSGQPVQPALANYDITAGVNATFLQFAPNQLQPGQLVTVTVQRVTSGGVTIGNSGNNTFSTRVRDDQGNGRADNGGGNGKRRQAREITESVEDAVAYPLLTEQVSFPTSMGAPAMGGAAPAGMALGQSAIKAVTDVLGWKVNPADPKGFIGALTQAFTLAEIEGHVEATWNPRTYAVQTDLGGGITGAQASLYTRSKDALDQSLPLLDGLYPLDPDADPEYVKALREMARSQMNEIVKELGAVGGPSVLRVNTYFGILLGTPQPISFQPPLTVPVVDPDQIQGTLGTLRDTYGIYFQKNLRNNPFSNSIEDEQDITNFRVISDYMTSLLQSWISNGQFFILGVPSQPAFFGTQLVLISRQFSVIAETVNEVRFALDSVFIGPSERQTLLLQFRNPGKFPAIFLEELLQQIGDFFNVEATGLLQYGGRISVTNNILPVVSSFLGMVTEAKRPANLRSLPDGYRTVRVQRSLDDLRDQLSGVINLVQPVGQQVLPPLEEPGALQVLSVGPLSVIVNTTVTSSIAIMGAGFVPGATCAIVLNPPSQPGAPTISLPNLQTQFLNQNLLGAQITVTSTETGQFTYNVTVTNPDQTRTTLQNGLTITVI
ncbi:MAG TPA: hypothetical protein VNX70_16925 [Bryobacteraceae bacterium]|nr:hypothetical protein [Bryobacteraceae bacterium]